MSRTHANILLVEDEPIVRTATEGVLSSFGHTVTAVGDGAQALEAISAAQPDLILCDVRMPVIDGFQLLQKVRSHSTWCQIPFIIVSAKAESADFRMGMSLGADDYVAKPYQPADLQKTIEMRLERAKRVSGALENQQQFLSRILPYELRTPLTGIIGYADLMLDTASDGRTLPVEELHEYGRMIKQSGSSIFRIVKNLMFWARLEMPADGPDHPRAERRSKERLNAEDLQLWAEIASTAIGRQKDVVVEFLCPEEVTVDVITPGLEFIVSHLIENAFKYSLPGAPVRIKVELDANRLRLTVTDSGRGMSEEQVARIGLFQQFDRQRLEQPGLGMGLMLAMTFARKSGGDLEIRHGQGTKGLSAVLSLPVSSSEGRAGHG